MKIFHIALVGAFLLAGTQAFAAATVGESAPDFTASGASGKDVRLSDYKGKFVVLEWTSTECPFVHKWYNGGDMQKLQKKAAEDGVVWLSVDSSAPGKPGYLDAKAAAEWIKEEAAAPAEVIIDAKGEVGHLYGATTTPHMFVIDKEGKLAYAGAIDSIASAEAVDIPKATNYVQQALDELKAGKFVSVATTKSYGCGVKY
ncbi:MAG: redoxin domain-containing protein [Alphaproteobacteria bacterium]|nr:MAG: redoxin domain-containing protein [Alphaproteobacteria bacterium]